MQVKTSNYQIKKFTFRSTQLLVLNAGSGKSLQFKVKDKIVAVDSEYGLDSMWEAKGIPITFSDNVPRNIQTLVHRVQKELIAHALYEGMLWLKAEFDGPQAVPAERWKRDQIVDAIGRHRSGGWISLVQDCLSA